MAHFGHLALNSYDKQMMLAPNRLGRTNISDFFKLQVNAGALSDMPEKQFADNLKLCRTKHYG